jgi:starch phosphorylase
MVRDYVEQLYEPAARGADAAAADNYRLARDLAAWKRTVRHGWPGVAVRDVQTDVAPAELGTPRTVTATVAIDGLAERDLTVQLIHGMVGPGDELVDPNTVEMEHLDNDGELHRYRGSFFAGATGRYGCTVRVVPRHEGLATSVELGLVAWAN